MRIDEPFDAARGKTFVARRPESARLYGESLEEFRAKPGTRVLFEGTPEFGRITRRRKYDPELDLVNQLKKGETLVSAVNQAVLAAEQAGYDAVSFLRDSDIGTVILNDSAFDRMPYMDSGVDKRDDEGPTA